MSRLHLLGLAGDSFLLTAALLETSWRFVPSSHWDIIGAAMGLSSSDTVGEFGSRESASAICTRSLMSNKGNRAVRATGLG